MYLYGRVSTNIKQSTKPRNALCGHAPSTVSAQNYQQYQYQSCGCRNRKALPIGFVTKFLRIIGIDVVSRGVSDLRNHEITSRVIAYVIYAAFKFKFPDRSVNVGVVVFLIYFIHFNANNFNGFGAAFSVTYESVKAVNNLANAQQTYQYKRYNIFCHGNAP